MAKSLCRLAGIVFIIVGLAGFAMPTLLGFHLTPVHNIIHILTGAIAAYLGFSASYSACRTFCLISGFSSTFSWGSSASWRRTSSRA